MLQNKDQLLLMAKNGKYLVREKYNWTTEQDKLYNIYDRIMPTS